MCESDEDTSDCESTEEGIFPLDCGDLDLEQIENNWESKLCARIRVVLN